MCQDWNSWLQFHLVQECLLFYLLSFWYSLWFENASDLEPPQLSGMSPETLKKKEDVISQFGTRIHLLYTGNCRDRQKIPKEEVWNLAPKTTTFSSMKSQMNPFPPPSTDVVSFKLIPSPWTQNMFSQSSSFSNDLIFNGHFRFLHIVFGCQHTGWSYQCSVTNSGISAIKAVYQKLTQHCKSTILQWN